MLKVKSILLNVFTGAAATVALLMVLVAYSDRLHPADWPTLACAGMAFPFFLVGNLLFLFLMVLVRWRRAWIPVAAFVLAFPSIRVYLPMHFSAQPPAGSLKVLSYNVACYLQDKKVANPIDSVFSYVRQQQADIVCLQEDVFTWGRSGHSVGELYPYSDTLHVSPPGMPYLNALGIYSRYPILRRERIRYESEANGSVAYFLQVGADTVIVVNNHLESTHLSESDRQHYRQMLDGTMARQSMPAETRYLLGKLKMSMVKRARQAEAVHRYVEAHSDYPLILCGDFNDTPISYVRRTMAQGLADCYVESGNGVGVSFNVKGYYFRIDHMMCSSHFTPYHCYVDNSVEASDHYPVVCWFERH